MPPRGERGAAERIRRELDKFMKDPPEGCTVELDNDNLFRWKATIQGPPGTPYEGGVFHLILVFQQDYPFTPPKALFLTKVYHCNIASTGNICMDILTTEWSPALTVSKILLSIISLLSDPNPEDPLEPILADLLKRKRADYEANARLWTSTYAVPDVVAQNPE
ncbi:hypothetical protein KR054_006962 [Drosophila jambulina]|nr:hypothetical protein KR054_006962 [Drosophila jambulina]